MYVHIYNYILFLIGRTLEGQSPPALGLELYLSDKAQLTPTSLNGGFNLKVSTTSDVTFNPGTVTTLSANLEAAQTYALGGVATVMVSSAHCAETSRHLCAKYVILADLGVPWRDYDNTNDYLCVDVSSKLACHDSMYRLLLNNFFSSILKHDFSIKGLVIL